MKLFRLSEKCLKVIKSSRKGSYGKHKNFTLAHIKKDIEDAKNKIIYLNAKK